MIQKFVDRFMAGKEKLRAAFSSTHPEGYGAIVKAVIEIIAGDEDYEEVPDPERIHTIDDGDYQGTLLFVVAAKGYQPSDYWYVKVGYGSCSVCDTFKAIRDYDSDPPKPEQTEQYLTLALHVVQGLKKLE